MDKKYRYKAEKTERKCMLMEREENLTKKIFQSTEIELQ